MKPNELRIGNHALIESIDNKKEIGAINEGQFASWILRKGEFAFYPISLTEEWLMKFGFELSCGYFESKCGRCTFEYWDENKTRLTTHEGHNLSIQIEHVHQLQNLYFALTGEELTIK